MSLLFAIPDHPWVDTAEGAAVRIAMTVGEAGEHPGELRTATAEEPQEDGSAKVAFAAQTGRIAADLTTGADVAVVGPLQSNVGLALRGMTLVGEGFLLIEEEAAIFLSNNETGIESVIRLYISGSDLTTSPRRRHAIDLFGLSADDVRARFPAVYQRVLTLVKPERDQNKRASYREKWWVFAEPRTDFRAAVAGLDRYIGTSMTAKHRTFTFLPASSLPDQGLIALPLDDAFHLGVLSSRIHVVFALAAGSHLGVGNGPVYDKTRCFDPFPFHACDEAAKARIRALGEELDAHRKRVQAQHPGLSLTAMYNVLEKLRAPLECGSPLPLSQERSDAAGQTPDPVPHANPPRLRIPPQSARGQAQSKGLTPKEQAVHDAGLVSVLRQLHDELDAAVAAAYGWVRDGKPETDLSGAEILTRLVALNAERAAEEAAGTIRWLRPEYQTRNAEGGTRSEQTSLGITVKGTKDTKKGKATKAAKLPWPTSLAERVAATERALKSAPAPVTPAGLAKTFTRAKPEDLAEILETLATLGRAHRDGEKFTG